MTQANATHSHSSDDHGHGDEPHVLPLQVYLGVWGALMVLTILTVAVSRFDFGSANTFVALIVATIKGSLVVGFFMHLRYDNRLYTIILLASLLFVSIFFTPTLIDLHTRDALDPIKGRAVYKLSKEKPEPLSAAATAPMAPPPAAAAPAAHAASAAAPAAAPAAPAAAPAAPAAAPAAPAPH